MTQKEFIKVLDKNGYHYYIEGDKIIINFADDYGNAYLRSETSLPPNVVFNNRGLVDLYSLKEIPPGVEFKNGGAVNLNSLIGEACWAVNSNTWEGNIKGIDSKRLLNLMIKKGMFI